MPHPKKESRPTRAENIANEQPLQRTFRLMAMRSEIDRMTHLENIPKERGKRSRTPEEDVIFHEVGRAYYGRKEVFGAMAENAAMEGNEEFFRLSAKYLAKIKAKERERDLFTAHVMWALVFVFNAEAQGGPSPTKGELKIAVRRQLKSRGMRAMDYLDEDWKSVWKASPFLADLDQSRPGSIALDQ